MAASTDIWSCLEHMCPQLAPLTERRSRTTLAEHPIIPQRRLSPQQRLFVDPAGVKWRLWLSCQSPVQPRQPLVQPVAPRWVQVQVQEGKWDTVLFCSSLCSLLPDRLLLLWLVSAVLCHSLAGSPSLPSSLSPFLSAAVHGSAQPPSRRKTLPALVSADQNQL